jgi:hypothetical protein
MQLEQLSFALRKRNPWEAIDLGCALVRENFALLMKAWALGVVPVLLVGLLLIALGVGDFAVVILWWLKPWYERVMLHALSQRMFGAQVTVKQMIAAMPMLLRRTGLLSALTIRRLSLMRTFRLPIWQLEGLRGKELSARSNVLSKRSGTNMVTVTVMCSHLETFFMLALVLLGIELFPMADVQYRSFFSNLFDGTFEISWWVHLLYLFLYAITITIIGPMYLATGFALYLSRRCELEAWDLELQFRLMARRLANAAHRVTDRAKHSKNESISKPEPSPSRSTSTILSILAGTLLVASVVSSPSSWAATPHGQVEVSAMRLAADKADDESPKKDCKDTADCELGKLKEEREERRSTSRASTPARDVALGIINTPEFDNIETRTAWVPRHEFERDRDTSKPWRFDPALVKALATVLKILGYTVIALALIWLIYKLITTGTLFTNGSVSASPPSVLFGLDVRPESLPPDIAAAARSLLANGDVRGALSLLFRATLVRLIAREVPLAASDTEGDCERRVKRHEPQMSAFFNELSSAWQLTAYAHRLPSRDRVAQLIEQWAATFASKPKTGTGTNGSVAEGTGR